VINIQFPTPIRQRGRLYWDRFSIENHKRSLAGIAALERDASPIELVPASQIAREFGFGRRTLGRLIEGFEQSTSLK
jgi:hypothetical protein